MRMRPVQLSAPAPPTFAVFAPRISLASAAHVPTMLLEDDGEAVDEADDAELADGDALEPSLLELPHAVSRPATVMASRVASREALDVGEDEDRMAGIVFDQLTSRTGAFVGRYAATQTFGAPVHQREPVSLAGSWTYSRHQSPPARRGICPARRTSE